ncbi:hypothetical protein KM043_003322 [Ampulex compressa]|nr:hypothetical protein KM043_003322 [Ampulex compressa]
MHSRFPSKGRIAILGCEPIWIKGPHGAGTAPLAALGLLHDARLQAIVADLSSHQPTKVKLSVQDVRR